MSSLDQRCVAHFRDTIGKFHTTQALSVSLKAPAEQLRDTLISLYRTGQIDRYVLVTGDAMTGYYGHHKGIQPGTALINSIGEGRAA